MCAARTAPAFCTWSLSRRTDPLPARPQTTAIPPHPSRRPHGTTRHRRSDRRIHGASAKGRRARPPPPGQRHRQGDGPGLFGGRRGNRGPGLCPRRDGAEPRPLGHAGFPDDRVERRRPRLGRGLAGPGRRQQGPPVPRRPLERRSGQPGPARCPSGRRAGGRAAAGIPAPGRQEQPAREILHPPAAERAVAQQLSGAEPGRARPVSGNRGTQPSGRVPQPAGGSGAGRRPARHRHPRRQGLRGGPRSGHHATR